VSLHKALVTVCAAVADCLCDKDTVQSEMIIRTLITIKNSVLVFIMVLSSHHVYAKARLISYKKQFFDTDACNGWAILNDSA